MNPRVKYIIIGSIFAVITIIWINELRIWVGAYQPIQDFNNELEQQYAKSKQDKVNSIQEKCVDNPDFLYCNNN
jgi:hypothetical protein